MNSARPLVRRRRRKASPPPGAWSIVLIDGAPIRKKARRDYDKVLRELEAARSEAERFEAEDKPKFSRWVSTHFGALLTEIRELHEKLSHAQGLVTEVHQEFYVGEYRSIASAYKKVLQRREAPEEPEADTEDAKAEAEFREAFENAFGKTDDEFWETFNGEPPPSNDRRGQKERAQTAAGLKDIYRKLVRRLHPDKKSRRSPKETEWWHQTQAAYETGNIEQLEMILTLVEMEEKGPRETSASVLNQLTIEFKKNLKVLRRKILSFKKDLAWNFSRLVDFSELLLRTRAQLQAERDQILGLLHHYQRQIESWEASASLRKSRVRPRARRGAWQDEEWF